MKCLEKQYGLDLRSCAPDTELTGKSVWKLPTISNGHPADNMGSFSTQTNLP